MVVGLGGLGVQCTGQGVPRVRDVSVDARTLDSLLSPLCRSHATLHLLCVSACVATSRVWHWWRWRCRARCGRPGMRATSCGPAWWGRCGTQPSSAQVRDWQAALGWWSGDGAGGWEHASRYGRTGCGVRGSGREGKEGQGWGGTAYGTDGIGAGVACASQQRRPACCVLRRHGAWHAALPRLTSCLARHGRAKCPGTSQRIAPVYPLG